MQRLVIGKVPRIAVVGAGLSGLRCADVLLQAGARVTIFEARDRVGGRVHQQQSGGHWEDLGPNWIHGTQGNPISKLAERTGTVAMEPEEGQVVFDPHGKRKSLQESKELGEEVWATIVDAFKYSDEHSTGIGKDVSLMDFFKQELPRRFPNNPEKVESLEIEARMWGPFVGAPIERQSLKFFFLEECLDGENVFVAGTYKKILEEVARVARKHADVRLNEEVTSIEYRSAVDDERSVMITTKSGIDEGFDEVVVTCPLGWLKRNEATTFTPRLPERLSSAIHSIGYGKLEKLYVTFPSCFWLEDLETNQAERYSYPCFTHFQLPLYHPFPESKDSLSWNQSVVSLAHLPQPTNHPTLLFYFYGDCGSHLTNLLIPHEPHSPQYNQLLDDFAHPFYSRLPGYDATSPVCKPTAFLLTAWQLDRHAGYGSYSNFPVGLERADEDIEVMRNAGGLSEEGRGLWLAGEHTAPFVAVGTTTGAWWSGEGVARRIAKQYGLDIKEEDVNKTIKEAGNVEHQSGAAMRIENVDEATNRHGDTNGHV